MHEDNPDETAKPRFATGREMYERLARTGPPLDVTIQGLPPRRQGRMSVKESLSKGSERPHDRNDPAQDDLGQLKGGLRAGRKPSRDKADHRDEDR